MHPLAPPLYGEATPRVLIAPAAPGSTVIIAHVSRKQKDAVGVESCRFESIALKDMLRSPNGRDR
jgi:hypothetical protein